MNTDVYRVSEEVAKALLDDRPVVALESTVISHGLPYPENVTTAIGMEEAIRSQGAIPATIGIIKGMVTVGLSKAEIEFLANDSEKVYKVGVGELDFAVGLEYSAATTVSATSWIASFFKIPVFATGGIGGVHRGVEKSWDVSQDISVLGKIPVLVVCAGAKSILDLPKTLELLESYGVLTVGYKTNTLPAFYSHSSGLLLSYSVQSPQEAAKILYSKMRTGTPGGILVCNPIPVEFEIPFSEMEILIQQCVEEAERQGITQKALTPFLLKQLSQKTSGRSIQANKILLFNNCRLAAQIAIGYNQVRKRNKKAIGF